MPYKNKHSKNINKLVKWAKEVKQITVVIATGQVDRYMPEDRLIVINGSQTGENQLHTLLHECGHSLNRENGSLEYRYGKYQLLAQSDLTGKPIKSYAYRVQLLDEEMQAWKNGKEIASGLGMKIDEVAYENCAAKCIMSYVDWAAEREWNAPA
jgi:hypothetical protein|tara:strand:- start:719 stop:1180 length:462 start_codon:yes stop_codon:yes gene_type:complete